MLGAAQLFYGQNYRLETFLDLFDFKNICSDYRCCNSVIFWNDCRSSNATMDARL